MLEKKKEYNTGNSLAVQWLGLRAPTAEGVGLIPGQGTKIPQATRRGQKKKKKKKRSTIHGIRFNLYKIQKQAKRMEGLRSQTTASFTGKGKKVTESRYEVGASEILECISWLNGRYTGRITT